MKPAIRGLYAITPEMNDTALLLDKTQAALRGGAALVQYRSKSADVALKHAQATELLELCRDYHVPLIVNDDVRLAALIDADGVHVGEDDARLIEARINLGPDKIIGVSCYQDLARALQFEAEGADYVAFGSFFASTTKPAAERAELDLLREARAELDIPIAAIGGITVENGAALVAAGADLLAVVSGVFGATDIRSAARGYAQLFV